jgi:hypothetical protein
MLSLAYVLMLPSFFTFGHLSASQHPLACRFCTIMCPDYELMITNLSNIHCQELMKSVCSHGSLYNTAIHDEGAAGLTLCESLSFV